MPYWTSASFVIDTKLYMLVKLVGINQISSMVKQKFVMPHVSILSQMSICHCLLNSTTSSKLKSYLIWKNSKIKRKVCKNKILLHLEDWKLEQQDGPSLESSSYLNMTLRYLGPWDPAHKGFTITPNVNYKCPRSVAAIALPVAAMALPQPPIYLRPTWKKLASQMA